MNFVQSYSEEGDEMLQFTVKLKIENNIQEIENGIQKMTLVQIILFHQVCKDVYDFCIQF